MDVRHHVDGGHARVAPRGPQLLLGIHRHGRSRKERVAMADPLAALAADNSSFVDARHLVQPPLGAGVAPDPPPIEPAAQPAAPEEDLPDAAGVHSPVTAAAAAFLAVQAALVAADDAL